MSASESTPEPTPGCDPPPTKAARSRSGWKSSLVLGVGLFLVYSANGRAIGTGDTVPAMYLPVAMLRGDGPFLDRFGQLLAPLGAPLPYYATWARGHIVSRYPLAPALLALPFELPQVWLLDRLHPGWDTDQEQAPHYGRLMAKNTAAIITALVGVALLHLLRRLGLGRAAWLAVFAACLGSDLWTVASQSLWQHGPAALALTLTIVLLLPLSGVAGPPESAGVPPGPASAERGRPARAPIGLAGLTTAALVACRPADLLFAVVILLWLVWHYPRALPWFLAFPLLIAVALLSYNTYYFGTISGGQAQIEGLHPVQHGVVGTWTGNLLEGAAGTLGSPSRGLFVFCPWIALALATVPALTRRLRPWSLVCWLLWAIVPFFLVLSKHSTWWAGHCFGPRYWTDITPLFAVVFGFGLDWAWSRCRPVFWVAVVTVVLSCEVQVVGALCYPSSWEDSPADIDQHHERLWDWRDSELSRCLEEGIQ